MAGCFYHHPSRQLAVLGVTGTNGKTSVSHFIAQALAVEKQSAVIGTLGWGRLNKLQKTTNTTPDAVSVQAQLTTLLQEGVEAVAVEVSSHGLDQQRVAAIDFRGAIFTNLSRDHLDFHGSMQAYKEAKLTLFACPSLAFVVLNVDDAFSEEIRAVLAPSIRVIGFGRKATQNKGLDAFYYIGDECHHSKGLSFSVKQGAMDVVINAGLLGVFNVDNLTATLATLVAMGATIEPAAQAVESITTVAGRMESYRLGDNSPTVVVDYAHTPDALRLALKTLRVHCDGEVIVVFGCGGNRDKGKRALMGSVADQYAQQVYVTSDNPREESAEKIAKDILEGFKDKQKVRVVLDRQQAIEEAVCSAASNDIVLLAGKGHEGIQQFADINITFDDAEQAKKALAKRKDQCKEKLGGAV